MKLDRVESEVQEWIIRGVRGGVIISWNVLLMALVGMSVVVPVMSSLLIHDGFLSECLPS